jgi:polar amino acid transport system ATP-binding protein
MWCADQGWHEVVAPIIEIDRVSRSFGHLQVLNELSFKVGSGERLALIGSSGSGKTTVLRILMILETISGE